MANQGEVVLGMEITELRLGLPGGSSSTEKNIKKRIFTEIASDENSSSDDRKDGGKKVLVGWPPICSYRKNNFQEKKGKDKAKNYVKISMDGAPFLRKIDLNVCKGYTDLSLAFDKLFGCFGIGLNALKESDSPEKIPIYEDKDGDWMLVGDVPWEMFIDSCKRLRIMRSSEAKGFDLQIKSP